LPSSPAFCILESGRRTAVRGFELKEATTLMTVIDGTSFGVR
jgi:hypothetical protein